MTSTTPGGSGIAARSPLRPRDKEVPKTGGKGLNRTTQNINDGAKSIPTSSDDIFSILVSSQNSSAMAAKPIFRKSQIVGAGPDSLPIISCHKEPLQPRDDNVPDVSKRASLNNKRNLEGGLKKLGISKSENEKLPRAKAGVSRNENQLPNSTSTSATCVAVQGGEPDNSGATSRRGGSNGRQDPRSPRRGDRSAPTNDQQTRPCCVTCGWELRYRVMLIARGVDDVAANQKWSFIIDRRAPGDPPLGHWCGIQAAQAGGWIFRTRHARRSDRHDRLAEHTVGFLHQADVMAFQAVLAHYPINDETSKAWCLRSLQMACEQPSLMGFDWNNVQEIMVAFQETIGSGWTGSS